MYAKTNILLTCSTILLTAGCMAELTDEAPRQDTKTEVAEVSSPIRLGIEGGGVGAVEIAIFGSSGGSCSGFLVGGHMVLTASHCFDGALGGQTSGMVAAHISLADTGTAWRCIAPGAGPANGKCTTPVGVFVQRLTGSPIYEKDLAAVFTAAPGGSWSNVSAVDGVEGFYAGPFSAGESYVFYGRGFYTTSGTGHGVMRYMTDNLDWVGPRHFVTDATTIRICDGDSGGPYFRNVTGFWAFGIHSGNSGQSGTCVAVGAKARGTRLTPALRDIINGWRVSEGIPICQPFSSSFPDYWVCQ